MALSSPFGPTTVLGAECGVFALFPDNSAEEAWGLAAVVKPERGNAFRPQPFLEAAVSVFKEHEMFLRDLDRTRRQWREAAAFSPRTELGRKLWEMRQQIIASG